MKHKHLLAIVSPIAIFAAAEAQAVPPADDNGALATTQAATSDATADRSGPCGNDGRGAGDVARRHWQRTKEAQMLTARRSAPISPRSSGRAPRHGSPFLDRTADRHGGARAFVDDTPLASGKGEQVHTKYDSAISARPLRDIAVTDM